MNRAQSPPGSFFESKRGSFLPSAEVAASRSGYAVELQAGYTATRVATSVGCVEKERDVCSPKMSRSTLAFEFVFVPQIRYGLNSFR